MNGRRISIGMVVLAVSSVVSLAQTPVLSSIEAPYAAMQGMVQIGGHAYGPGAVAYGPAGTPLVLTGSDLGTTGTVEFIAYKNGAVDTNVSPISATPTLWTSNIIFVPVPSGAYSGMVEVMVEGKNSNPLPFVVTPGVYAGTCPAGPPMTQLQITTSSLHDGGVGQSYSATLNATGGTQSYTWSVASGTLPAGLSLNASTGTISGTPTTAVSPASVTFEVTDSSSPRQNNQALLDITIEPQQMTAGTVYSYTATYDGLGNVTQYQDTVMGTWNFSYDALNRLQSGSAVSGGSGSQDFTGQKLCWAYDSFGNRTAQSMQTAACPSQESSLTPTANYNANNQITGGLVTYDPSGVGNITYDSNTGNTYLYDGEDRICAVKSEPVPGTWTMTGYIYDADGTRVAKGTIQNINTCDPSPVSQGGNGFQLTENYVLGPGGEELTMLDGSNNWQRTNLYAAGKLIGTYDAAGLHFHLEDPLGTRRMQLSGKPNSVGQPETDIQSLPYGDQLYSFPDQYAPASADDATPLHFTGKERDQESGNDYFGARYYASTMGRWLSPDKPFADQHTNNPQSWNLYEYGRNNPLRNVDLNGFKVLQAVLAEAVSKINTLPGGTLYLDFAGIQGLHGHPSLNASNNFDGWHSDHSSANSVIIPNNGIVSGFFRALFGLANKDQADTGKAIVAAAKSSGQDVAFDTYSNGVNAAGQVAQGMSPGDLQSATVVGPNANSPAPVQAMDQADGDATQIYISINDPALALALFGSQSADDWTSEFGDRVHVTDQPSHNLNQYRGAQGKAPWPGFCPAEFASCN